MIVGAGNLGLALADYPGFRQDGFDVVALFDVASDKVGRGPRHGVVVQPLRRAAGASSARSASTSRSSPCRARPRRASSTLVADAGIRAILNFAPGTLRVPEGVKLKSVDLSVSLESLSFFLAQDTDAQDS